jgi:hypothetical protein
MATARGDISQDEACAVPTSYGLPGRPLSFRASAGKRRCGCLNTGGRGDTAAGRAERRARNRLAHQGPGNSFSVCLVRPAATGEHYGGSPGALSTAMMWKSRPLSTHTGSRCLVVGASESFPRK